MLSIVLVSQIKQRFFLVSYHTLPVLTIGMKFYLLDIYKSPGMGNLHRKLLEGISNSQSYIAIMDDLMLHGLKSQHMTLFENLLKSLISHGLKLSPRKCQLFMKHLVYLGNAFHIEDGVITITPVKSRIEAIQKLPSPYHCKRM